MCVCVLVSAPDHLRTHLHSLISVKQGRRTRRLMSSAHIVAALSSCCNPLSTLNVLAHTRTQET